MKIFDQCLLETIKIAIKIIKKNKYVPNVENKNYNTYSIWHGY